MNAIIHNLHDIHITHCILWWKNYIFCHISLFFLFFSLTNCHPAAMWVSHIYFSLSPSYFRWWRANKHFSNGKISYFNQKLHFCMIFHNNNFTLCIYCYHSHSQLTQFMENFRIYFPQHSRKSPWQHRIIFLSRGCSQEGKRWFLWMKILTLLLHMCRNVRMNRFFVNEMNLRGGRGCKPTKKSDFVIERLMKGVGWNICRVFWW